MNTATNCVSIAEAVSTRVERRSGKDLLLRAIGVIEERATMLDYVRDLDVTTTADGSPCDVAETGSLPTTSSLSDTQTCSRRPALLAASAARRPRRRRRYSESYGSATTG